MTASHSFYNGERVVASSRSGCAEMSENKSRFRRISLTLGRKKKTSVDERYADLQRDSVADQNGECAVHAYRRGDSDN